MGIHTQIGNIMFDRWVTKMICIMCDWFLVRRECSFTTSILTLKAIHHPSQRVIRDPSVVMKWVGHEADHLPPTSSAQADISRSQDVLSHMKYGMSWASSLFILHTISACLLVHIRVYYEWWVHAVKNTVCSNDFEKILPACIISLQINPHVTHHNNENPWLYNLMTSLL